MMEKIAIEEHFMTPGLADYSESFTRLMPTRMLKELAQQLTDFDEVRLTAMDQAGIVKIILSQTAPGIQGEAHVDLAVQRARQSNDFLAEQVARRPDRYAGFATLPMQDPDAAVQELRRAVGELGMKGALVNGHTHGIYCDDRMYDPLWNTLQELNVPLYLHPTEPYSVGAVFQGHPELMGAIWGWAVETGTHALRLLFSGVFDRFPRLKVILGHMGEGLPFMRWRFDSRFAAYPHGITLQRPPSAYFGRNILITTSGVCSSPTLLAALAEMGAGAVLFAVDYPYESTVLAADFIENTLLDETTRALVCHGNARRLFGLS